MGSSPTDEKLSLQYVLNFSSYSFKITLTSESSISQIKNIFSPNEHLSKINVEEMTNVF